MMHRRHFLVTPLALLPLKAAIKGVKALTFDVFGTVVDWRGSVIRECTEWAKPKGLQVDWARFADAWRGGYGPSMNRVRRGELPWTNLDGLHRMILDGLLKEFKIDGLTEEEKDHLNRAWHRLTPWPDAVTGMARMREQFVLATLSNGNVALLTNMGKHGRLPWDCILSAELARRYKPDREVYQMAADLLGLRSNEVMMVAAHKNDLQGARAVGFRSAFVARPLEFGPERKPDVTPDPAADVNAVDFLDLATKLGV